MNDDEQPPIKFIRLKTGDDLVTQIVELTENDVTTLMLIDPLKVVYVADNQGSHLQVAFIPWVFKRICDKQEFYINNSDVLMMSDVSEDMNDYYWYSIDTYSTSQNTESQFTTHDHSEESIEEDLDSIEDIMQTLVGIRRTFH